MKKRFAAVILTIGALLIGAASPAFAAAVEWYQGSDYAFFSTNSREGFVDDRECDGHIAYVRILEWNDTRIIADRSGCGSNVHWFTTTSGQYIQLCESRVDGIDGDTNVNDVCTAFKSIN